MCPTRLARGASAAVSVSAGIRAPIRRAVAVSLAAHADRHAAARAGAAGPTVDAAPCARPMPWATARLHPRADRGQHRLDLVVGHVRPAGAPRIDPRGPARLALPEVADAGDGALVEQRVADRPGRVVLAQPAQDAAARRARGPGCRVPARRSAGRCGRGRRSSARAPGRRTGPPHGRRARSRARRGAGCRRQRAPARVDAPRRRSSAGANGSSARPRSAGTGACRGRRRCVTARPASRSSQRSRAEARVRGAQLVGDVALEDGPDAVRRVVDGVAFGHGARAEGTASRPRRVRDLRRAHSSAPGSWARTSPRATTRRTSPTRRRSARSAARPTRSCCPADAAQVAAVVAWCHEHGVAVSRAAAGTGWAGGAVPHGTRRGRRARPAGRRIRSLDPLQWRMQVEAGVTTRPVRRLARENGLLLPARPRRGRAVADRRQHRDERGRAALLQVRGDRRLGHRARGRARAGRARPRRRAGAQGRRRLRPARAADRLRGDARDRHRGMAAADAGARRARCRRAAFYRDAATGGEAVDAA